MTTTTSLARRLLARCMPVLALGAALMASSAVQAQTSFTATYTLANSYKISGKEPSTAGKYPLFVYIGGTGENYNSNWAMAAVDAAVARGMVAATVEYANSSFGSCTTIKGRAKDIFNSASSYSAISKLCARAKVDCSKGIVTGGLSQGSIISVLSKDYDSRVRASLAQGTGTAYSIYNLSSCMTNGNHKQPGDRIRVVNGEEDLFVGGTEAKARASAEAVTGKKCTGKQFCFNTNGSGWYIVKNNEVADGQADHCFMGNLGTAGTQCSGQAVDPYYQNGTNQWGVKASMDWLKTFVTP